ncbi:MAG: DUF4139 domain-containing protein [Crocinitomicaceae bacterium]|nr:DUF4139 domain-containing protein [Crocinitomicaceae bacterium]
MEKMKKGMLSLFVAFAINTQAAEKEIVKAQITEVTVYAQGAQLFQKANYSIKPGISEVIIEGISPYIDQNSLQVKATGSVVILDSKYSLFQPVHTVVNESAIPLKIRREIRQVEDSLKMLGFDLQEIQDEIDVLITAKSIISNNSTLKNQGKVTDSLNLLKQAVEYYSSKVLEINKKILALRKRKVEREAKKSSLDERLQKLREYQENNGIQPESDEPIHRITVTLSAKEIATGKLTISYLVENAGWVPRYDLRSDGMTSKINLTYKAQVFQSSGLDWENVRLNISTNNPYQNKTKPSLNPWYIDYNNYRTQVQQKTSAKARLDEKAEADNAPMAYTNSLSLNNVNLGMTSADFVQVVRQMTSAEFKIDLPYTIKSDNEQHMVLIKVADLNAEYKYFSIPKLDNSAYLVAQLTNLDELGLVPAQANIFYDGTYIGETYLDPSVMEDTLSLSLGKDPNILVKRVLLKKESKERIIGETKERTMIYSIEVKNNKATPIELIIQDQLPITQNPEITIEPTSLDKGNLETKTGIVTWKINLKPKDNKTIDFGYKVKHKKDQNIQLY